MQVSGKIEDQSLLSSIREGDSHAFDLFFLRHYAPLCAYARQFVSQDTAQEVVQDLMARLWEARSTLQIAHSVQAYLFRSVRNRCLTHLSRHRLTESVHTILENRLAESFENPDFYVAEELQSKLSESLQQVPESFRDTFVMHCFQHLSHQRIADILGVSKKTVDYRIRRTRTLLRLKLREFLPIFFV